MSISISIGSDHAGFELKKQIIDYLKNKSFIVIDKGCFSEERADYPDFAHHTAESVITKESEFGILIPLPLPHINIPNSDSFVITDSAV